MSAGFEGCTFMPDRRQSGLEHLTGKRVYIETYGCRYNFGDTAKLIEILRQQGCTIVQSEETADAVIINTCTVVAPTERRMLRRLVYFRTRDLYVTGCMPVVQRDAIMAVCTPTIIPPRSIQARYCSVGTVSAGSIGIIQISQGCNGQCTYCITKNAPGRLKSYPLKDIISQLCAFIQAGAVEIQLTAQDVSAWGRDRGTSLPELLHEISHQPGNYYVRVGMMNPATVLEILDDLVEAFSHHNIFRFIHIPVQSGSDRVLQNMGRGYTAEDFEQLAAAFRKKFSDVTLATDMIVGFPHETDDDFKQSLALIDKVRPNKANVTRFSKRPFTPAFSEKEVPGAIKKDRSRILNARAEQIYHAINAHYPGRDVPFIVTEHIKTGSVMARTPSYLGIVLKENLPVGFQGRATIKGEKMYFFTGERIHSGTGISPLQT
jgi:threonylcarbamoyladenosine tRNA methylthiotransferase CDKAL1